MGYHMENKKKGARNTVGYDENLDKLGTYHLNAVMRILQLETFFDSENDKEGDHRWRLLVDRIFRPAPGETLRQNTTTFLKLGKRSDIPTEEDERMLQQILRRTQTELNKISKRLDLGAKIRLDLIIDDVVQCRCKIGLNATKIGSIMVYFDNLRQRGGAIPLLHHEYAQALCKTLSLIVDNIILCGMLGSYMEAIPCQGMIS